MVPPDFIDYLQQPVPQAVIWVTILLVMSMLGFYLVQKFRDQSGEDQLTASELLTNFREMNQEGDIDDGEFRTIKTVLAPRLQEENAPEAEIPERLSASQPETRPAHSRQVPAPPLEEASGTEESNSTPLNSKPKQSDSPAADSQQSASEESGGEDLAKNAGDDD